jgi:hypothetical protein
MPMNFDLEALRKQHDCKNYFETGLWDPREQVSSKVALGCGFDKVYCIEIQPDWVRLGNDVFKEHISSSRYNLFLDDSANMKKYLTADAFKNKTMFFLDAHVDNKQIKNYVKKCPLFHELDAISGLERKDNVILVDDLRIITKAFPWGEMSYGKVDFLQQIKNVILTINIDYKFTTLDGHVKDDILLAYVS